MNGTYVLQLEGKWVIDGNYIVKSKKPYNAVLDNSLETDYLFSLPQSNRYKENNKYFDKINDDEKSFAYRDIITKDISLKYFN